MEDKEFVMVRREDIIAWRNEWMEANVIQDGTDCVTPFDMYLYEATPCGS